MVLPRLLLSLGLSSSLFFTQAHPLTPSSSPGASLEITHPDLYRVLERVKSLGDTSFSPQSTGNHLLISLPPSTSCGEALDTLPEAICVPTSSSPTAV